MKLAARLALAGLDCIVVAVRVSPPSIMNEERLARLAQKTTLGHCKIKLRLQTRWWLSTLNGHW